ncbi:hypothetical protein BIT28_27495 [Photobacterium proteolyticum]|uniref:Crp/Fnr family transcriptional regulator n=1 Tax=Photobacterium proteolyticum TaxID=1903952 RepID=A0A1Q9H191_9GAMM|nr:Crp/Fnr family transcriptional regulator [Photobacterium proteolyticum]OLQ81348.1 hypothetical protein BIT28_27495 [Photobacterium proteolyticum]
MSIHFHDLSSTLKEKLHSLKHTRNYQEGQYIHYAGDAANRIYLVENGNIRISKVSDKGKELTIRDLKAGEWFGFIGCFGLGVRPNDAVATEGSRISHISLEEFVNLADLHPDLWKSITKQLASYVEYYNNIIEGVLFNSLVERTWSMLRQLCIWQQTQNLNISQKELASLLGVTKEATGLQLKKLESDGLISLGYKSILVLDKLLDK